jgi:hypothetical protein
MRIGFHWWNLTEKSNKYIYGVDHRIILKIILNRLGVGVEFTHLVEDRGNWQRFCAHWNELLGYIKAGKFLDLMWNCWLC